MYKINENIVKTAIGDKIFLLERDSGTNAMVVLNDSGGIVLEQVTSNENMEDFIKNIENIFGIDEILLKDEILPFIEDLEKRKIIIKTL